MKTIFTSHQIQQIHQHWPEMPNPKLAKLIGVKLHALQEYLHGQGMLKMRMEYWGEKEVEFLQHNYQIMGDVEIAENLEELFPKQKPWTKKHVEKKRKYLGINRSPEELRAIKQRNVKRGNWANAHQKMWKTRGTFPEGTIRYWHHHKKNNPMPYIKVEGKWVMWARYRWTQLHGPIPKGMNVVFRDGNSYHRTDDNLELLTNAELAKKNGGTSSVGLSDNYIVGMMTPGQPALRKAIRKDHPELIEIKRLQLQLNRTIHEKL